MAFRFQRRIKIAPGIRLNISKTGISTTLGKPGTTVTVNKRGGQGNAGLPGTGLSTQTQLTKWQGEKPASHPAAPPEPRRTHPIFVVAAVVGVVLLVWFIYL